jgi:uncharacterized protein YhaN
VPAGDLQPLLGGGQVVAIEDAHAVARQERLAAPAQGGDKSLTPVGDVTDQFGRNGGLDVLEFLTLQFGT